MSKYNERLEELKQQIARKNQLYFTLKDLKIKKKNLTDEVYELERSKDKKQAEVNKLEKRSISGLCYKLTGKVTEKLEWARKQASETNAKYEEAKWELQQMEAQIREGDYEMMRLGRAEERYQQTLEEKALAIIDMNDEHATELIRLSEEIERLEGCRKELKEAISAGESARNTATDILSSLESAHKWGTWDLVGGGLISDLAKHSHLDDAQSLTERLKHQVSCFKTELMDVTIHADFKISIDGFLRFADYFWDGLLVNWTVLDKIKDSQSQIQQTKFQINSILDQLNERLAAVEQEINLQKNRKDTLVLNVDI